MLCVPGCVCEFLKSCIIINNGQSKRIIGEIEGIIGRTLEHKRIE